MFPILKSNDMMCFVDGSESFPSQFLLDDKGKLTTELNLQYTLWHKKDQFVLRWINATLSNNVVPSVFGITSAKFA